MLSLFIIGPSYPQLVRCRLGLVASTSALFRSTLRGLFVIHPTESSSFIIGRVSSALGVLTPPYPCILWVLSKAFLLSYSGRLVTSRVLYLFFVVPRNHISHSAISFLRFQINFATPLLAWPFSWPPSRLCPLRFGFSTLRWSTSFVLLGCCSARRPHPSPLMFFLAVNTLPSSIFRFITHTGAHP